MVESSSHAIALPAQKAKVAPHPPITGFYKDAAQKRPFLTSIFDDTAADYDRIEQWLSLGSGRWYRRQAILRAGLKPGMVVADIATGTGLVAREALAVVAGGGSLAGGGRVVGVDPSAGMLARAGESLHIETHVATAEALPFEPATFDFLSMGYALRHVEDLGAAFGEFHRVLRPGGRACILEITRPKTVLGRVALRVYLSTLCAIISRFVRLSPRTPELWAYYWQTIDQCVPPESVLKALRDAGFTSVKRDVSMGVFSEYTGTRS